MTKRYLAKNNAYSLLAKLVHVILHDLPRTGLPIAWSYNSVRGTSLHRIISSLYLAFMSFASEILNINLWGEPENYELLYGVFDYNGKIVLDVGADYGSTVDFFLAKGARHVVAVECNRYLFRLLAKRRKTDHVTPLFQCVETPLQFRLLILKYKPEVAKVDCEGCEISLLNVDDQTLSMVKEWVIEVHSDRALMGLQRKFQANGFNVEKGVKVWPQALIIVARR